MAIALVQTANPTATTGNTVATFAAPTTPGNLIVCFIGTTGANDTVGTPTDDAGNTYVSEYASSNNGSIRCYFARNAQSAENITGVFVGTTDTHSLIVREYSGMSGTNITGDVNRVGSGTSTALNSNATTTSTSEPTELIVCSGLIIAGSASLSLGAGFSNLATNNFGGNTAIFGVEDKIVSSTGTQTGTMTSSVSGNWDCGVGCFKGAPLGNLANTIKPIRAVGLSTGYASN